MKDTDELKYYSSLGGDIKGAFIFAFWDRADGKRNLPISEEKYPSKPNLYWLAPSSFSFKLLTSLGFFCFAFK